MNVEDESIQELQYLLKEITLQIEVLMTKKEEMASVVKKYDEEITNLKVKQHELSHQIEKLKTPKDYIWSNIGDGG